MTDTEKEFCLFCMGKGTIRDSILLREIPCPHCLGKKVAAKHHKYAR